MKFAFVRLFNPDLDEPVFMRVDDFMRYKDREPFFSAADQLIVFDYVYVGCFDMFVSLAEILEFNPYASVCSSYDLHDIAFGVCGLSRFCNLMGYDY